MSKILKKTIKVYENAVGDTFLYINDELNSYMDLPAIIRVDGSKVWYEDGQRHRDGGKPAVEYADGSKEWYEDGQRHRDGDKPAVEYADGYKAWYKNGKLHRDNNKPAVEYEDGIVQYWIDGVKINSFVSIKQKNIKHVPENITEHLPSKSKECVICLEDIDMKECYTSLNCFHFYHKHCLERNQHKCAICQK